MTRPTPDLHVLEHRLRLAREQATVCTDLMAQLYGWPMVTPVRQVLDQFSDTAGDVLDALDTVAALQASSQLRAEQAEQQAEDMRTSMSRVAVQELRVELAAALAASSVLWEAIYELSGSGGAHVEQLQERVRERQAQARLTAADTSTPTDGQG